MYTFLGQLGSRAKEGRGMCHYNCPTWVEFESMIIGVKRTYPLSKVQGNKIAIW
jgi:hypothetical protein